MFDHIPQLYLIQNIIAAQIDNYVKYPPRQKAASFNLDSVMAQLEPAIKAYAAKKEAVIEKGAAVKKGAAAHDAVLTK